MKLSKQAIISGLMVPTAFLLFVDRFSTEQYWAAAMWLSFSICHLWLAYKEINPNKHDVITEEE